MARHGRERLVVARKRVRRPVETQQRVAAVDARANMRGVMRQRFIIACERFIDAVELKMSIAEIVEDFGMTRRQRERIAILHDGVLEASRPVKREAEIRHRIG